MCLLNVTTKEPLIAEEDITVYKFIKKSSELIDNWKDLVSHGDECIATINNVIVNGSVSISTVVSTQIHICTNNPNFDGDYAEDMLGYKYSWILDTQVTSIIIKDKEIIKQGYQTIYQTIYQKAKVVIGEEYTSKLILQKSTVNIGLHSYIKKPCLDLDLDLDYILVKCIIPKYSNYFIGDYEGRRDSIASDTLKYVKNVEKNIFEKLIKIL